MKDCIIILLLIINSFSIFGQTVLIIEGTTVDNTQSGMWEGVNITRNQSTVFTYRNNSITSVNSLGYMLQAGDEDVQNTNNNLTGELITGNKFTWNGTDMTSITHGVFTGYNINATLKHNYLNNVPMGLIRKSNGMTNTSGGVAYNIVNKTIAVAAVVKGMNGVNIFNNTFYSEQVIYSGPGVGTWRGLVDVYSNTDIAVSAPSTGTKIKNNIFYTKNQIFNIMIYDADCLPGFESDYNIFWCEAGTPMFNYLGTAKTFAQWQALGYDTHSRIINPNFNNLTDFVPGARLDYGTNLGSAWQTGLSTSAVWTVGSAPATTNQNGTWQVGARIYSSQVIPVSSITVTGEGGATAITTDNGSLQLSKEVLPVNATEKNVTWSVINETGQATISSTGLLTAVDNGTVTARATAVDGSGVYGTLLITISNQIVPVTGISVTGSGGTSNITTDNGSLQLSAEVFPSDATNKSVTWSLVNGTGKATINSTGLVTAIDNGTVTARATANDGSGVTGTLVISIYNQVIPVTGITISGAGGAATIIIDKGSLQLSESVLPADATDKTVTWSVIDGTGGATINSTGLLTAINNGTVTARATANDGSGIYGTMVVTISNQTIKVTGITVTGSGGLTSITDDDGSLQLIAAVFPADASDKTITWSLISGTELATIVATGLVTAIDNGTITARAMANDGSGTYGTLVITISNQIVPVTNITITASGGMNSISTDDGTLQLIATVLPGNATNKTVTWSLVNGTGEATINSSGLVTAINNGTVTATATANDATGFFGTIIINISNQIIPVTGITITGAGGLSSITADNGTLQLSEVILPLNASDKTVSWSIVNGTGQATINVTGLVTAVENGTVTARATANDGSGIYGTLVITITNQITPVTNINVTGFGGASIITTINGSLQTFASVLPANATIKEVTWSIVNGTGQATINVSGLVTAISEGTVTAVATANDGSGVNGNLVITISTSLIPVTGIVVTGAGGMSEITTDNGSLQLSEAVLPVDATVKSVTWSIINGTGHATISATGLVTAVDNGNVTARAGATDGSGVYGTLSITISNQVVAVTNISVSGPGGAASITEDDGTLQLSAEVLPVDATNKNVFWSIVNGTGQATINSTGLVTAIRNGTVTATATANDGSGVNGSLIVAISNQRVPVSGIIITGDGGATTIDTDNGSLQLTEEILPADASDKTVTWSIVNGSGQAVINSAGLVTAVKNGTVTARATANDGSGEFGTLDITISNQIVPVTGITVTGSGGATIIATDNGSLQLNAAVLPADATDNTVIWSIISGTSLASISTSGLLTAIDNGNVTVRATANDGSGVYGTLVINISNQILPVTSITVRGSGGRTTITTDNGTLQLSATVIPSNATNKSVTWSLVNVTGQATINASGRVTAIDNGTVTARATANDGSGVYGTLVITISNQFTPVTGITISGPGGSASITVDNGSLQLSATILPANATNKSVTWSLVNVTGQAAINASGVVTAIDNGTVTARATANDGSGVYGTLVITLSNQIVPVNNIIVTGSAGATIITADNGSLQMIAEVLPTNASDKSVTWSLVNGTGKATISASGIITADDNGTVTAIATANDGTGVYGTLVVTIFNQVIPVAGVTVTGAGGATTITADNGSLQLSATVLPVNATDKTVTWSIVNGTGRATIDSRGLVTALDNGTVTATAESNDGSGVYGSLLISISNQTGPVTSIIVTGAGGASSITTDDGSLQLTAVIFPANATIKTVTWSFVDNNGLATINSSGLVTAIDNGTITARATANDGSGVYGTLALTINNQLVPATGIAVTGTDGANTITSDNGTLQLSATVLPSNAKDKTVTWSLSNGTGQATISSAGLVTALDNGTVIAMATSNDGSGVFGTLGITISNQVTPVSGIIVTGAGNATTITSDNGTLQLSAAVLPYNATDNSVTWSLVNGTGEGIISINGLVTAVNNGIITARATANDGSGIYGTLVITISNQLIHVTAITITGSGGANVINTNNGTLQLFAAVIPSNATNKTVTWSLNNGTGQATISSSGIVTASKNGTITARATANDGSGVSGTMVITVSGQIVPVAAITVTGENGETTITNDTRKLQLVATVFPENSTNRSVIWSITNGTGVATINSSGLVTAVDNGRVTVKATASDGSGIYSLMEISVTIDNYELTNIIVTENEIRIPLNDSYKSWIASLYNLQGGLVLNQLVTSDIVVFDISSIPSGLFIIVISNGTNLRVAKVVIP